MCHRANKNTNRTCRGCGYQFGQSPEKVRGMLQVQLRRARTQFWFASALTVAAITGFVVSLGLGLRVLGFIAIPPLMWAARSGQTISISKKSLASIDRQQPQLPKATLVEK
jgi:hypothetical protein